MKSLLFAIVAFTAIESEAKVAAQSLPIKDGSPIVNPVKPDNLYWSSQGDGYYCRGLFGYRPRELCIAKLGTPSQANSH